MIRIFLVVVAISIVWRAIPGSAEEGPPKLSISAVQPEVVAPDWSMDLSLKAYWGSRTSAGVVFGITAESAALQKRRETVVMVSLMDAPNFFRWSQCSRMYSTAGEQ